MAPGRAPPSLIERAALPSLLVELLHDDETALYYAQPIRRAGGIGVWMILALGVAFTPAAVGALREVAARSAAAELTLPQVLFVLVLASGALVFLAFSLMMLVWPWLSERDRRRTHVVVTDQRVVRLKARRNKAPRVKEWPVAACDAASVARRRGASATLVLREKIRIRLTDDRPVYEWDAVHGLPRADDALAALEWARAEASRKAADALD